MYYGQSVHCFVCAQQQATVSLLAEQDLIHIGIKLALGVSQLNVLAEMFIKYALGTGVAGVSSYFVPYVVILLLRKANYFVEINVNLNDVCYWQPRFYYAWCCFGWYI